LCQSATVFVQRFHQNIVKKRESIKKHTTLYDGFDDFINVMKCFMSLNVC